MNIIQIRRYIHSIAELSNREYKTQEFIINYFSKHDCKIITYQTSVLIVYNNEKTETIGFRAEEDALPIIEKNAVNFKSKSNMHACGHDGHMAMLMKLGDYINRHLKDLTYRIVLIFQMAEENGNGSWRLIQSGIIESFNFKYIYALHLYPGLYEGKLFSRPGPLLSRCCELDIDIIGKSSHVASKELGIDANDIWYQLYKKINHIKELKKENITFLFGKIEGGSCRNSVSSKVHVEGTIRTIDDDDFVKIKNEIEKIKNQLQEKNQCQIFLKYNDNYQAVFNDYHLFYAAKKHLPIYYTNIKLIGDDFCHYQKLCPCLYLLLGINSDPLHSETFNFNENVLIKGLKALVKLLSL